MIIVHLEDDGPLREILKTALTTFDPKITLMQFISSDDTMDYARQHLDEIALFILDVRVPGKLDGMGVAREVRALQYNGHIVVTSAYRQPEQAGLDAINCLWLQKPWHILEAANLILPLAYKRPGTRP